MKQAARFDRRSLALGLGLGVALVGCGRDTGPGMPGTPPADAPTALVYGMVNSPVYEALKDGVRMTVSDGSQKAAEFDLIMLDGDGFTGQQLSSDALVREALQAGIWVLGLDTDEEDKLGFGDILYTSSGGNVNAYLVRQDLSPERLPTSRLIEFKNPTQRPEYIAEKIVEYLGAGVAVQQTVPGDVPPRALTYFVHHTSDYSGQAPQVNNPFFNGHYDTSYPTAQAQDYSWTVDHTVSLFLDAAQDPTGDFQHVLVDVQGRANPGTLGIDNIDSCSDIVNAPGDPSTEITGNCEIAWIQTRYDASVVMPEASGLDLIKTSPTNTNNTETVTSGGYSFSIGYSEDSGASASFQYTSPQTQTTITDWEVNDQSNTSALWSYASNTIYDGMTTNGYDSGAWEFYFEGVAPRHPNNLAVTDLQYATESYWTNNQTVDETITVAGEDTAWLTDAYVVISAYDTAPNDNSPYCVASCYYTQHMARDQNTQPWTLDVDMSAVIPVLTKSLSFSKQTVEAGDTVTATLTLEKPTPIPAEVLITSDSPAITPEHDTYTVPANEDTLIFNVLTGADTCKPVSGTIKAFYADGQNAILTVDPPPSCS